MKTQLDDLKSSINLIDFIGQRIPLTRKSNSEAIGKCPFHQDDTPSFSVYFKNNTWLWTCFGACGETGNVFQFVQKFDKLSFEDARKKIESLSGWSDGKTKVERTFAPVAENKKLLSFPLEKMNRAELILADSEEALKFLESRGISYETAKQLHVGFTQSCKAVNENHEHLNDGWLIFPFIQNKIIYGLKYRSIVAKDFLHARNMKTGLFNLDSVCPFDDVFLVEGELDALTLAEAGFCSVAMPGANYTLTPEDRDRLLQANRIILAGDMDAAGQKAMSKLWRELKERTYKLDWPDGVKDANEYYLKTCRGSVEIFQGAVERLKEKALERPMESLFSLKQTLSSAEVTRPMDDPRRLRFPWKMMDEKVFVVPGDVMGVSASESKCGKTTWLQNILLHNAISFGKVILNYSAELSPAQYGRRVASQLTKVDRELVTQEDQAKAAVLLGDARFYNGYKPGASWQEVIELLKTAKRRFGADIIVIDHIHFLVRGEKDQNAAQESAMKAMKDMAIELDVIMIVVGQPRKAQQSQRGKQIVTQDVLGSVSFGTDASQTFLLHRDRIKGDGPDGQPVFSPITKVTLDYSRESEGFVTRLYFDGVRCTFVEMCDTMKFEGMPGGEL